MHKATRLSASMLLSLCPADGLVLTCTSNASFLEWRITDAQGTSDTRRVAYDIASYTDLTVGTTEFHFSLNSQLNTLPHISQVQADRVTNGTAISCSVTIQGNIQDTQNTTICIIGSGCGPQIVAPELNITEQSESFGVVTSMNWIPRMNLSYNISVFPEISPVFTHDTSIQLTIPYNIQITINVSATLCGEEMVTMKRFFYATCGHPLRRTTSQINNSESIYIRGYKVPVREGTIVSFSCLHSQLVLTGPSSSTCMRNGEWEPDPVEVECKEKCGHSLKINNTDIIIINRTLTNLTFMCKEGFISTDNRIEIIAMCTENNSLSPDPAEYNFCVPQPSQPILTSEINRVEMSLPGVIGGVSGTVLFGIILIFTTIIGITVFVKRKNFSKNLGANINKVHCDHKMPERQDQGTEALVYADIGVIRSNQQSLMTLTTRYDADEYNVEYAVLNHELCKETTLQPVASATEPIDQLLNLDNLLIQVQKEVTPLWYQFGEALGVKNEILNSYTECSHDQSIIEVLDYWLRNYEGQPSWKEVAIALKKIGLQRLGLDIEKIYKTGKLSIEMDSDECDFPQKLHKISELPKPSPGILPSKVNMNSAVSNINDADIPPPIPPKIMIPLSYSTEFQLESKSPVPARPPKP